jgi:late competence protein required for DNA uptake (superfamily II DNA/RNA helicase)
MIRVYNCQIDRTYNSLKEAADHLGMKANTLYSFGLPFSFGGFEFERVIHESKRHITCTRCGSMKWDTEFYTNCRGTGVNQPCKKCQKEQRQAKSKSNIYNPRKSNTHYRI